MLTELRSQSYIASTIFISSEKWLFRDQNFDHKKVIEIPNWGQQFIADAFNEKFREAGVVGVKNHEGNFQAP